MCLLIKQTASENKEAFFIAKGHVAIVKPKQWLSLGDEHMIKYSAEVEAMRKIMTEVFFWQCTLKSNLNP